MSTRVRIAILGTRGIPAKYGGFETFAEELSLRLVQHGYDVTVFCERRKGLALKEYKGIRLEYVPSLPVGPLSTLVYDACCLWRVRKGFDVVYMLGYGAALFCILPRLWGTTVWINPDGIEWARSKWGGMAKMYLKLMEAVSVRIADRIIADAEGIQRHLMERHCVDTPFTVIPYGAEIVEQPQDPAYLNELGLVAGQYYLVVCRLEPENHVADIVRGYSASSCELPLVVVGDQCAGTSYVRMLLANRDTRIRFVGTIYDRQKLATIRYYCRAYFHGHSVGGTNPSLLEALGCGNIIIAHDNPFNREVALDCALYFRDASMIVRHVSTIESMDDRQRHEWRGRSQHRVRDDYTWESAVEKYREILREDV